MSRERKTTLMRMIERQHPGKAIERIVAETCNEENGSVERAAERLGVSAFTLRGWMDRFGIELKTVAVMAGPNGG